MKTDMAIRSSQDSSSKRHFHWTKKVGNEDHSDDEFPSFKSFSSSSKTSEEQEEKDPTSANYKKSTSSTEVPRVISSETTSQAQRRRLQAIAVSRLRSVLTAFGRNRSSLPLGLGPKVVGTLFGSKRGHVHFAFQKDPNSKPALLIELATPISGLVKEMASGLVRIALECDKEKEEHDHEKKNKSNLRLFDEPLWRTYCNGKKCGFATKRDCGVKELKILKSVEPISTGAGVLPEINNEDVEEDDHIHNKSDGEIMYMRAKFERIVGSRDSEAFYMMNPDSNGAPELSIYLLRI